MHMQDVCMVKLFAGCKQLSSEEQKEYEHAGYRALYSYSETELWQHAQLKVSAIEHH